MSVQIQFALFTQPLLLILLLKKNKPACVFFMYKGFAKCHSVSHGKAYISCSVQTSQLHTVISL